MGQISPKYLNTLLTEVPSTPVRLHAARAAFLEEEDVLIFADLHIGKAAHFRRNGFPIPAQTNRGSFWRMVEVIEFFRPQKLLFLGDLIHSKINNEWEEFLDVLDQFGQPERILVKGNHDVEEDALFQDAGFNTLHEYRLGNLRFVHEPDSGIEGLYTIAGHLHPAVSMRGSGRQHLRLPCFWFAAHSAVMPAFGEFTGSARITPAKSDEVFVIADNQVIRVN